WLLEKDVFVDQFTEAMVADPARIAESRKVEVLHDPAITALGAKMRHKVHVELHLNDSTVMKRTVESARGSEFRFASDADIIAKFEKLAVKALPKARVVELRDAVMGLEKLSDATVLSKLLSA
ncbi:MAG: MmgE/PrpD family protein, partial [Burkholderiales bacterium]|nr:MmgE/PrpD family protein [Burkholderiales bacterium]